MFNALDKMYVYDIVNVTYVICSRMKEQGGKIILYAIEPDCGCDI